jgi:hypothetical protein
VLLIFSSLCLDQMSEQKKQRQRITLLGTAPFNAGANVSSTKAGNQSLNQSQNSSVSGS